MKIKHYRTFHIPGSPGSTNDDKFMQDMSVLKNSLVVQTEKLDGEVTSIYKDGFHARSTSSLDTTPRLRAARWQVRKWHSEFGRWVIHDDEIIIAENLSEQHSIEYFLPKPDGLIACLFVFGIVRDGYLLSWDDTKHRANELGLLTVPEIYRGKWDDNIIASGYTKFSKVSNGSEQEGYVVRCEEMFPYNQESYSLNVGKWVRAGHVQTEEHWTRLPSNPNFRRHYNTTEGE